ncbi:MAG: ATP-binding protein [Oscillospiraceae bacterium]|nr:ATP-binding protein [Oscillospiraceae bacterium]
MDIHDHSNISYEELLHLYSSLEIENKKLKRELRTILKRQDINKLNNDTQMGLNRTILNEKQTQETYLRMLLVSCPDLIFIFNKETVFLVGSKSIEKHLDIDDVNMLIGCTFNHIVEKFSSSVFTKELVEQVERIFIENGDSGNNDNIYEFVEIDNDNHKFKCDIVPIIRKNDEFAGVFLIMSDITSVVRKEIAEQESRSKSNFLARMSHELRTPLNAILGMAELSIRENLPKVAAEYVSAITQAGENLLDILNDILDISKIETGQLEIIPEEYTVSSLINDVINIIKPRVLDSQLCFTVDINCDIPSVLKGDVKRIRQIILNVLSNAVKYTDKGYVSLLTYMDESSENSGNLVIKIEDSGKGIKKDDLELIFEEYTRFDMIKNKGIEGSGLGLAITKNLVNAMNGEIYAQSEVGKGSIFTVVLPQEIINSENIAQVNNRDSHNVLIYERREICISSIEQTLNKLGVRYNSVSSVEGFHEGLTSNKYSYAFLESSLFYTIKSAYGFIETNTTVVLVAEFGDLLPLRSTRVLTTPIYSIPTANVLNGYSENTSKSSAKTKISFKAPGAKLLVVDDINTNLFVAKGLMQPYEMEIDLKSGGAEAIEAISSNRYDLIFMDHMMPKMDGIEATAIIREMGKTDPYYAKVPIIALTANTLYGVREYFIESGFDDFLPKPIDIGLLNEVLKKWIPEELQEEPVNNRQLSTNNKTEEVLQITGINTKRGLSLTGGIVEHYNKTLLIYLDDGYKKIEEIRSALESNDISLFITYIHALRSASAGVGAEKISAAADTLEQAGLEKNEEYIYTNIEKFLKDFEALLKNISESVHVIRDKHNKTPIDKDALNKTLHKLKTAFEDFDIDSINKLSNELEIISLNTSLEEEINRLMLYKLNGEYDKAVLQIDELSEGRFS